MKDASGRRGNDSWQRAATESDDGRRVRGSSAVAPSMLITPQCRRHPAPAAQCPCGVERRSGSKEVLPATEETRSNMPEMTTIKKQLYQWFKFI